MKTSAGRSSSGYGKGLGAIGCRTGEGLCTSMRGAGIGMVSCRPILDGGLDRSLGTIGGGYVACQSESVTDTFQGDDGRTVVVKDNGDVGLVLPLDAGRVLGGESRSLEGGIGDGALCTGELGRDGALELMLDPVCIDADGGFLLPWSTEDEEDRGD